jgi:hypothetical protein
MQTVCLHQKYSNGYCLFVTVFAFLNSNENFTLLLQVSSVTFLLSDVLVLCLLQNDDHR